MPPSRAQQPVHRPSDKFLRRIDRLDKSSPNFPDQLANLLGKKVRNFTEGLPYEDVEWFIEYLDNVLGALDPGNPTYRECLDQLGRACFNGATLPQSQIFNVPPYLVSVPNPTGPDGACYEGSLNNSRVCLKKLKPLLARLWNTGLKSSYFRDIVEWKYLTHSNIVPFLGIIKEPIQFVSVLVPGKSVTAYIASSPDTVDRFSLLIGIVSGLEYLHSRGVVHGDLGGPNIIIDDSGHPQITNFGLGAIFPTTVFDEVCACGRWASPEVLHGGVVRASFFGDIFSFAMVIVEAFSGQVPFFPETNSEAQSAIVEGKRPARPTHPDLTGALWALIERCWDGDWVNRPGIDKVVRTLHDCRSESMRKDGQITQLSKSSKTTTQNSTLSENGPLGINDTPKGGGSDPSASDEKAPILPSTPPTVPVDWFSQIANEILDLTDQVASVALFGPIGVGKSFIVHATLDHDRTRATFGNNSHFIRCDDLNNSPDSFIKRLSEAVHVDVAQLQPHLETSPPLMLVLDGVDAFLDPPIPEAEEVHAMIEEFGSYEHVCLVTTSRMYPDIQGFHRINIPAPPEDGARDIFYSLCDLGRSSTVDALIARLDFHPLSIKLLASTIRENNWDEATLLKVWDDQTSVLREICYRKLKDAVEPMFHSPTIKNLGDVARDVLGAIAAFPSGIEEHQLRGIFHAIGGVGEVVDVLCRFSLVSRRDGLVRMPSPFQFYFLESMLVVGEAGKDIKWGPDCMPAKAWLPIYTQGPPEGWSSDVVSHPTLRRNASDGFPRATPVFTSGPPGNGPSHTTSHRDVPARKMWIRRLPKRIKQRLLVLFGRRIKPTVLVELYEGPAGIPPIETQEDSTDAPPTISLEGGPANVLSPATQNPTPVPPVAVEKDLPDIPHTPSQDDPVDVPHLEPDPNPTNTPLATLQQQLPYWIMPEAYEVW